MPLGKKPTAVIPLSAAASLPKQDSSESAESHRARGQDSVTREKKPATDQALTLPICLSQHDVRRYAMRAWESLYLRIESYIAVCIWYRYYYAVWTLHGVVPPARVLVPGLVFDLAAPLRVLLLPASRRPRRDNTSQDQTTQLLLLNPRPERAHLD